MAAIHITKENFEKEVLQSDQPVLVDFGAKWCGPCKMLLPIIEKLSTEIDNAKICKIDVDEQGDLAAKYGIMTIPTLMVVKDGKIVSKSVGLVPETEILRMLEV